MTTETVYRGTEYAGTRTRVMCNVEDDDDNPLGKRYEYDVIFEKKEDRGQQHVCHIDFQKGSVAIAGVNGMQDEGLLLVLIDRLRHFQQGLYACRENADALEYLERAHACMEQRKRDRIQRGVEGMNKA